MAFAEDQVQAIDDANVALIAALEAHPDFAHPDTRAADDNLNAIVRVSSTDDIHEWARRANERDGVHLLSDGPQCSPSAADAKGPPQWA